MTDRDVVVVGAGVTGAATAWALAARGVPPLVLERSEVGHARGSSHGAARVFRFSYDDPSFVRMAQEALPLWRRLEEESGEALLTVTGGLDVGVAAEVRARALESAGASFAWLGAGDVRERFPSLELPGDEPLLFQPDAGVLAADRAIRALLDGAVEGGAVVREATGVDGLEVRADGVVAVTGAERIAARAIVVAAGAWAKDLVRPAGIALDVTPTRETVAYFPSVSEEGLPVVVDWRAGRPTYALRSLGEGMKVGRDHTGPVTDPDLAGRVDEALVTEMSAWVASTAGRHAAEPGRAETCLYTNTPDESFVLERHGSVVVGSPCSGHGFKFAPLTGQRLAALAMDALA